MLQTVAFSKTTLIYCGILNSIYCKLFTSCFLKNLRDNSWNANRKTFFLKTQLPFVKICAMFACFKVYGNFQQRNLQVYSASILQVYFSIVFKSLEETAVLCAAFCRLSFSISLSKSAVCSSGGGENYPLTKTC